MVVFTEALDYQRILIISRVNLETLDVKQVYELLLLGILVITAGRENHFTLRGVREQQFY